MKITTTKLILILSKFSKEEVNTFEKWLASPWCNPTKCLVDILVALKKHHPEFDNRRLTKRLLFEKALGRVPSDRRMNNLLSEMYLQAEQFLVHERVKKNHSTKTEFLLSEFLERNLNEWFAKKAQKEITTLKQKEVKETEDYFYGFQLYRKLHNQPSLSLKDRMDNNVLENFREQLKLFVLLENAASINASLSLNRALRRTDEQLQVEIENWKTISIGINHPSINLYRKRFDIPFENNKILYRTLKPIFLKNYKSLSFKDQKIHFALLLNNFLGLRKTEKIPFKDALPIYKLAVKEGWVLQEGAISGSAYGNILSASNSAKDFKFSQWFIDNFAKKLPVNQREEGRIYGLAQTLSKEEKYEKAIELLLSIEFKSNQFNRNVRLLTTQIYFDLHLENSSYQSFLLDYCDAFEKWLRRDSIKQNFRSWLRFVQFVRSLSKLFYAVPFEAQKIEALFEDTTYLSASDWLKTRKEKIIQMKKK